MKKITIGLIVVLVLIGSLLLVRTEVTDRFNPLIPKKEVYVQINKPGIHRNPGGYDYTLDGYTESGEKQVVTFYAGGTLRKDAFLKVFTKGKYVKTWEEVQPNELPEKVKNKMNL